MLTWADAHRLAIARSTRVRRTRPTAYGEPVDLDGIAIADGVVIRYAPLPSLAGAYVASTDEAPPGIIVNTRLPWSKQRYTLGHELGHHYFAHGSQTDLETDWLIGGPTGHGSSDFEKLAEAFSAWLLMPRDHFEETWRRVGNDDTFSPPHVYRLSLLFGVSYRAACVHLATLGRIKWSETERLLRVQPKLIKREILVGTAVAVGRGDVHVANAGLNFRHDVRPGDLLLLDCPVGTGDLPNEVMPVPGSPASGARCVVIRASEIANPARPSSRTTINTPSGPIDVVIHHELNGVSEIWFR